MIVCAAVTSACGTSAVAGDDKAAGRVEGDGTTFAVVGDSITAGDRALVGDHVQGAGSWVPSADGTPLSFIGGWAVPGSTTAAMRDGVEDLAVDADVLVLLGGTNDLTVGLPTTTTIANLEAVATTVGSEEIVLVAVPPKDAQPSQVDDLNEALAHEAADNNWVFVNPWTSISDMGRFADGTSTDGVHPVQAAADAAGERIRQAILAAGGD